MNDQAKTPMSDHIARFWELLRTEHVRVLVDIRREHDEGNPPHWDSASFGNDVAKALAANLTEEFNAGWEEGRDSMEVEVEQLRAQIERLTKAIVDGRQAIIRNTTGHFWLGEAILVDYDKMTGSP